MFPRHRETNPHFLPSELPPENEHNAPTNPPGPTLQRTNQPRRQRTGTGPVLEPNYPLHAQDQDPRLEPQGRPRGPARATVLPPESPDYPNHYPLHPHGKSSSHSPEGSVLPPPPRRSKTSKSRVKWDQQPPPPAAGNEQAPPPGRSTPSVAVLEVDEGQQNPRRGHRRHHRNSDLLVPQPRKTKALTWLIALCCALFWIIIIVGGLIVLIVYLVFRPHIPKFDISSATLNAAYLDMDYLLNADLALLVNFTNPNRKVRVDFSYVILDLYYGSVPIATQYIEPFSAMRAEYKLANVHMISSQVRLPPAESQRLRKQIENNGPVLFEVKGLFRARSNLGSLLRYSYPLYGYCYISLTGPPSGVLRASRCKTKR